ncbi:hypothetical protein StrepF001_44255 [Streptomyces sp. F001]|nr:hypothetical protein StrepF001_44255 [Streptomyces sp. F001]
MTTRSSHGTAAARPPRPAAAGPHDRLSAPAHCPDHPYVQCDWAMERTFGWLMRSRRLARDYERRCDSSEAMILWSMTMLMTRRLAAPARARTAPTAP